MALIPPLKGGEVGLRDWRGMLGENWQLFTSTNIRAVRLTLCRLPYRLGKQVFASNYFFYRHCEPKERRWSNLIPEILRYSPAPVRSPAGVKHGRGLGISTLAIIQIPNVGRPLKGIAALWIEFSPYRYYHIAAWLPEQSVAIQTQQSSQ